VLLRKAEGFCFIVAQRAGFGTSFDSLRVYTNDRCISSAEMMFGSNHPFEVEGLMLLILDKFYYLQEMSETSGLHESLLHWHSFFFGGILIKFIHLNLFFFEKIMGFMILSLSPKRKGASEYMY